MGQKSCVLAGLVAARTQCRRVLLHRNGDVVDSYVDAAGDYMEKENAFSEQMTLWTVQGKGKETERTVPKPHDPARQMWRDFASVCGSGGRQRRSSSAG